MQYRATLWDRISAGFDAEQVERKVNARIRMHERARAMEALDARALGGGTGYEGGSQGHRWWPWRRSNASINTHLASDLREMQSRHRHLARNNHWVKRARSAIVAHWVGHGITAEIKAKKGFRISKRNLEIINELYDEWYGSTLCDADGLQNGYGLQALSAGMTMVDGEVYVRRRWRRLSDKLPVPLQLQVVSTDFCDIGKSSAFVEGGGRIAQGVRFDSIGRRVSYFMYREHPGDLTSTDAQTYEIPAADIAHQFKPTESGQIHGEPWGHANLQQMKDFDLYLDAFHRRHALANSFVGAVQNIQGRSLLAQVNADGKSAEDNPQGVFETESGTILEMPDGKEFKFSEPPKPDGYGPYTKDVLLGTAAGYDLAAMTLTGDLKGVSFTSGRMGNLDQQKNVDQWRWNLMIPMHLDPVGKWFLEAVEIKTGIDTSGLYFDYSPPPHELLDPPREVPATIKAIRAGLYSQTEYHRSQGVRTKKVLDEIQELNAELDARQIILDTDPRRVSQQGQEQQTQQGAGDGSDS